MDIVEQLCEYAKFGHDATLHNKAADEIDRLRTENAAQLAELHAISEALGTSEGHSSVVHIERLVALVRMLEHAIRVNQRFDDWELIRDALAAYEQFNSGETK